MKRSKHSLSNYKLLSGNMGQLIPIGLQEVLPGDTFQHSTSLLLRCSPLLAPVMHPVDVRIHHFFVPNRIMWNGWEDFITGGPEGTNTDRLPYRTVRNGQVGGLSDYFGIPPGIEMDVNVLPYRAYAMIYNEYYRDQDLQTEVPVSKDGGYDNTTSSAIRRISWEKDYFTSARPWEQKGPAITIPLGNTAPVIGDDTQPSVDGTTSTNHKLVGTNQSGFTTAIGTDKAWVGNEPLKWRNTGMQADLSNASAITINALRESMALQRYAEARARFGSRYTEYLAYLGVKSSDARLQRPEYLGGGRNTIQFSEVLSTAGDGTSTFVGEMKGHGIAAMRSNRYRRFFEEHGIIMSLLSVRPKTMYTQGIKRIWNKKHREDFWQMELEHIGQQEVLNKEVYAFHSQPSGVFGYQDRYDEYRRCESSIAGEFRESLLDFWHMGRTFDSDPALNNSFVNCIPTDRIFAVPSQDTLYVMAKHSIQARRLVAKTGMSYIF